MAGVDVDSKVAVLVVGVGSAIGSSVLTDVADDEFNKDTCCK